MTLGSSRVLFSLAVTAVYLSITANASAAPAHREQSGAGSTEPSATLAQSLSDPMSALNPFNGGTDATTLPNDARIAVFTYSRDQIYRVMTAPLKTTTIELAPGEKLISDPAMGDSIRWTEDTDGANHLFIKPSKPGLVNTLHISTNEREYDFTLVSSPIGGFFYQVVRFNYPTSLMAKVRAREAEDENQSRNHDTVGSGPIDASPDELNFDYTVDGDASWKPLTVFDDGKFIWMRMPDNAPFAVPLVKEGGDLVSPNSITRGQYLVVQRLADEVVLRSGKDEVKIYRGKHRFLGVF